MIFGEVAYIWTKFLARNTFDQPVMFVIVKHYLQFSLSNHFPHNNILILEIAKCSVKLIRAIFCCDILFSPDANDWTNHRCVECVLLTGTFGTCLLRQKEKIALEIVAKLLL